MSARTIPTWVGRTASLFTVSTVQTDHPHVGGENCLFPLTWCALLGPSPRGWGEHNRGGRYRIRMRTIPTWVGRTRWVPRPPRSRADHPHVGGENWDRSQCD